MSHLILKNAEILGGKFRNFSGTEGRYNPEGKRNFCVVIDDDEQAEMMREDGWNVKILAPREEGEKAKNYIKVNVNYNSKVKPSIYKVKGDRIICELGENHIGRLDTKRIIKADLSINSYQYDPDKPDVTAYLEELYVELEDSPFNYRYAEEEFPEE